MKCIHCQGPMSRAHAPFQIDRNGHHLAFDTVAAWICSQCGEPYFEEREVDAIQNVVQVVADLAIPHGAETTASSQSVSGDGGTPMLRGKVRPKSS